jgi:type VI secretion system protein ImpA
VALKEELLNPIPGPNPCGENLRYAPIYDQIKEARREEENIAQGEWQYERKKADWPLVVKLATDSLVKKTKDLQIAAWLTEGLLRREGFAGLKDGLDLTFSLLENFWDTVYPEVEDGDLELRAAPLEWLGSRLDAAIKSVPVTRSGLDWVKYKESRSVPYESDSAKAETRQQAITDGKMPPEEFDAAVDASPKEFYEQKMAQLDGCLESIEALGQLCEEKFAEYAPNFGDLRKSLEEVKQLVHVLLARKRQAESGEEAPAEEAAAAPSDLGAAGYYVAEAAAAVAPARAPARPKGPLAPEPVDRDDAVGRVVAAARYLRQNDAYSPAPYLMLRGLRWGELRAGGGSEPDAALLEAPPTEIRQELKRLITDGYYQEALEAAENAMGLPCGRGWLDLQRYAVTALDQLGYSAVSSAIKSELRALLADLPRLADLVLTDDTPTANAETRAWIQSQVAAPAPAPPEDYYARPKEEEQPREPSEELGAAQVDAFDLALEAARSGNVQGAIELLAREIAQEGSGRARFQRKVQLAQICMGAGHQEIAYPILQELAQEVENRRLEDWEAPETVAHALALLYRCMHKMDVSPEDKQKIYSRVCRLDPVQALSLSR